MPVAAPEKTDVNESLPNTKVTGADWRCSVGVDSQH